MRFGAPESRFFSGVESSEHKRDASQTAGNLGFARGPSGGERRAHSPANALATAATPTSHADSRASEQPQGDRGRPKRGRGPSEAGSAEPLV